MRTRVHTHLTLNPEVVRAAKECAGLIPFSRFVEHLLKKEVERRSKAGDGA